MYVIDTIKVGTEPYGLALTPSGRKLYVTNSRSNTVSVIDTATNKVTKTITGVGFEPRGIAITNSGGDDAAETVFVTQFLSLPVDGKIDGNDDAKAGHVTVIAVAGDTVIGDVTLNPLADAGFKAAGDAIKRIAPPATITDTDLKFAVGAYPNQLNNIAIRGKSCNIGGLDAPVMFAGAQADLAGVDQLNIQLPQGLKGRGDVTVVFTIDGLKTNPVTIRVQ